MCQNKTTHRITSIYGYIAITPSGSLLFTTDPREGQILVGKQTELNNYTQFAAYLKSFGLMKGVKLDCCERTVLEAHKDFLITRMLSEYRITRLPVLAPDVNALSEAAVNSKFNFWLENSRRWLQSQLRRFFIAKPIDIKE